MKNALRVSAGIFGSRVAGFVRDAAGAYFFGAGAYSDVFRTVLRIPNLLQNLLGEQTLSAAFIPGLSRMLEAGEERPARRFAGAVFGLLLAVASGLTLIGVGLARPLVLLLSPGYGADAVAVATGAAAVNRLPLAVEAVRWTFPMAGFLVLSAWALAVLNSHRRFLLPYLAPVLWNCAITTALVAGAWRLGWGGSLGGVELAHTTLERLVVLGAVGGLVGGVLQFGVQLPTVWRLMGGIRLSLDLNAPGVRTALAAFWPMLLGRGVLQLSAFLDLFLASLLAAGAQAALGWAQTLYLLPVSLFGVSVAAAELPELSRQSGQDLGRLGERVRDTVGVLGFLVVPTAVGYLCFGYWIVGAIYRRGNFGPTDTWLVYLTLAGLSLGLVASTAARQLQNLYYSLDDTRTPARLAATRVGVAAAIGIPLMLVLDRYGVGTAVPTSLPESALRLGAVGLGLASGLAAWVELGLLLRGARRRLGEPLFPWGRLIRFLGLALLAAVVATPLPILFGARPALLLGPVVVLVFAAVYLVAARLLRLPEVASWRSALPGKGSTR